MTEKKKMTSLRVTLSLGDFSKQFPIPVEEGEENLVLGCAHEVEELYKQYRQKYGSALYENQRLGLMALELAIEGARQRARLARIERALLKLERFNIVNRAQEAKADNKRARDGR